MDEYKIKHMYMLQLIALERGFRPSDLYWDMDFDTYWLLVELVESHMMIRLINDDTSEISELWGIPIHKSNGEEHCNLCISWSAI